MNTLRDILLAHGRRYPLMRPADAVKLIYQNEFGGGHLIRDEESCLLYLRREYEAVDKNPDCPLYEDIGNGIVRVHLAAVPEEELALLGQTFIRSAAEIRGSLSSFLEKLSVLRALTEEGAFAFDRAALNAYLSEYAQAGYPAVSHSPEYRRAYKPAYRVIKIPTASGSHPGIL